MRRINVKRNNVLPVRKALAHGYYHRACLCIDIRRNDSKIAARIGGDHVPVTFCRVESLGRLPPQTVEIFPRDVAVKTRVVLVELALVLLRFKLQIVENDLVRRALALHKIYRVSRYPHHAFCGVHVVSEACGHARYLILACLIDVCNGDAVKHS